MKIGKIDIPYELIEAQQAGKLVIFAGAGVSMPAPSSYPNFPKLADEIAEGTGLKRKKNEPIDVFIGRIADSGTTVHEEVKRKLSDPESEPNHLHETIINIFSDSDSIRLITTNFDEHFCTKILELQDDKHILHYYSPALPVGREFKGITYLHGCVTQDARNLTLTDMDFGRAYLTDGWARRFLMDVFNEFTVLFIGYSHEDSTLKYLARGLPPKSQPRFAFVPQEEVKKWDYLGIKAIHYPLKKVKNNDDKHVHLHSSLEKWVEISNKQLLHQRRLIKSIVKGKPTNNKENLDYVKLILDNPDTAQFFTESATHIEWLLWLEKERMIDPLFDLGVTDNLSMDLFSRWISNRFLLSHSEELFNMIARHKNILSPIFWHSIYFQLQFPHEDKMLPETFSRWILILLNSPKYFHAGRDLSNLLDSCIFPDHKEIALILFQYLTSPHVELETREKTTIQGEEKSLGHDRIIIKGDIGYLQDSWDRIFKPNLDHYAEKLIIMTTHHLEHATLLLKTLRESTSEFDSLSYSRSAIEPHEQNRGYEQSDILVDIARESLDWIIDNKPEIAKGFIELWASSRATLLNRLAIYGVNLHPGYDTDIKIDWILEKGWLYDFHCHHEVYHLLKSAFPSSSKESRKQLIFEIEKGRELPDNPDEDDKKNQINSIFRRLSWLGEWDPDDHVVSELIDQYKSEHPFAKADSEHPDLTHWMGPTSYGYDSPLNIEELLEKDTEDEDFLKMLLTHKGTDFREGGREGILRAVDFTIAQSFDWGWRLMQSLSKRDHWQGDLWSAIFSGFVNHQQASLSSQQWEIVLDFILDTPRLFESDRICYKLADLIEEGVRGRVQGFPDTAIHSANKIASIIIDNWDDEKEDNDENGFEMRSWLDTAINRGGGKIGEFLLESLEIEQENSDDKSPRIPEEYKAMFRSILNGESNDAAMGRVMIASRLWWLWALESDWIEEHMLPIFNWDKGEIRAQQAWHGYLFWGRWTQAMLPLMLPYYKSCFSKQKEYFSETIRAGLSEHLASIALFGDIDPIEEGWLFDYLSQSEGTDRINWANAVNNNLARTSPEHKQKVWTRLKGYWEQRNLGKPIKLSPKEKGTMLGWVWHLDSAFPEAVELYLTGPDPLDQRAWFRKIEKSEHIEIHPNAFAELMVYILKFEKPPLWSMDKMMGIVEKLKEHHELKTQLLEICNQLLRLGGMKAADLAKEIESKL